MNAKDELVGMVGNETINFGRIVIEEGYNKVKVDITFHSHQEYLDCLDRLNVEYDESYGGQELFGLVVFMDGSWLERGEYDGSEWWASRKLPTIGTLAMVYIR